MFENPLVLRAIRSFVPKQVLERVSRNPENLDRVGERREVTAVFVDIAGFTPMCEGRDAEEVILLLNELFESILEPVMKFGGTVDKFLGDAAMILFGAPVFHEDDPARAIAASMEIMSVMSRYEGLGVSIGVNTGHVVAGVVGNDEHREYTVIGDAVNVASRLESAAFPGEILVGPETFRKCQYMFDFAPPTALSLKGKSSPIEARKVIGRRQSRAIAELPTIIDRGAQWKSLASAVDLGESAILIGEAGLGKSTLLNFLRAKLEAEGIRVTSIEGSQGWGNVPYAPIQPVIAKILGERPMGKFAELIPDEADTFPLLAGILGIDEPDTDRTKYLKQDEKRDLMERLIVELVAQSSPKDKVVVFADSADHIDPSTRRILLKMANDARGNFTVVISAREFSSWMAEVSRKTITLKPLCKRRTRELLKLTLDAEKLSADLVEKVFEKTRGNPGFIVELARLLVERGMVNILGGVAKLEGEMEKVLPGGIESIMSARIDDLSADAREVVRLASVLGMEFPELLLREIAGESILEGGIGELLESGFLKRVDGVLKFVSAPLRMAAYESLFMKSRKQIHRTAGGGIEQLFAGEIEGFYEVLAEHYGIGEVPEKAFVFNIRAGGKQERRFANREAVFYYERALSAEDEDVRRWGEQGELLSAIESAGRLFWFAGDLERVIELNERARKIAIQIDSARLESDSINRIALANHELGNFEKARELYELLLEKLTALPDETERQLQAITNYGTLLSDLGELDRARELYLEGIELVADETVSAGAANLLGNLGWLEAQTGRLNEAERYLERSGQIDQRLGNLRGMAINAVNLAQILRMEGDRKREAVQYETAIEIFRKIGDRRGTALCLSNLGDVERETGEVSRARALHRESLKIAREIDDPLRIVDAELGLALDDFAEGKTSKALEGARRAFNIARDSGDWEGEIDAGIELLRIITAIEPFDKKSFAEINDTLKQTIEKNNPSAIDRLTEISPPEK